MFKKSILLAGILIVVMDWLAMTAGSSAPPS